MKTNSLFFKEVRVKRMPGIDFPGFTVGDLAPQLNIIYGPNGIGKTTLVRGMKGLLWPDSVQGLGAALQGRFCLHERVWFAEFENGRGQYQRDGSPSSSPALPPAQDRDRYTLALYDLLQEDTDDRSLAKAILKESMGGFRIAEAAEKLGFKDKPARKGKNTELAERKTEEWRRRVARLEEIEKEEKRLTWLKKALREASNAKTKLQVTEEALAFLKAQEDCKTAKLELERFPEATALIRGDELDQLKAYKESIDKSENKIVEAWERLSQAKKTIEKQDLPDGEVKGDFLVWLKERRDRLKSLEIKREDLQERLTGAKVEMEKACSLLGDSVPQEKLEKLDYAVYDDLSLFAQNVEENRGSLLAFSHLKEILNMEEEPEAEEKKEKEEERMVKGSRLLESWLTSAPGPLKKIRNISLLSALFATTLIGFLAFMVSPLYSFLIFIPLSIMIFGLRQEKEGGRMREIFHQQFQELRLVSPREWEEDEVRSRLLELYQEISKLKLVQRQRQYWTDRKGEFQQLKEKEERLNQERKDLISHYGLAPDTEERTLYFLTNRLSRWQDSHSEVLSTTAKCKEKSEKCRALLNEINERLKDYGYKRALDSSGVSENITQLERRREEFLEAKRNEEVAYREKREGEEIRKEAQENLKNLFSRLQLVIGDEERLIQLCQVRDDYLEADKGMNRAEVLMEEKGSRLEKMGSFSPEILEEDPVLLRTRLEELKGEAETYQKLYGEIKEIETRINQAKQENRVEQALASKERALDRLEDDLNKDYKELTGQVIADYLGEINTSQSRPEVFQRATDILTSITKGSYRLEVDQSEPPSFRAIETSTGRGKGLEELSSGTRVQLLMAVRMAFVESEEQGCRLPLFLDETLANTDDQRADAIIESIVELARGGRQAFYLTALKSEVARWVSHLEKEDEVEYRLLDLACIRDRGEQIEMTVLEETAVTIDPVPSALDLSHREYGERLSPPRFHPLQGAGSIHLWYLIEEVEVLEMLLKTGIQRWSQLKTLLEVKREGLFPEDRMYYQEELLRMGDCLEEFVESWQVGRGKPVNLMVLQASGAVSVTFIDAVSSLAEKLDGDGEKLVEALRRGEVSTFRSKKTEELEVYLQENGHIDPSTPLSREEIRLRMVSRYGGEDLPKAGMKVDGLLERLVNSRKTP